MGMPPDDDDRRRLSLTPPPYPLKNWEEAWGSVVKMAEAVNRIARRVEDIPDIKKDARGAHEQAQEARVEATRASTLAEALDARVERLEVVVGQPHACVQATSIANIESMTKAQDLSFHSMAADAAAARERLSNLDEDVGKAHQRISQAAARRREFVLWAMGVLIALLGTAAGAIWYIAQMAKTLDMESTQRQRDQIQIIERLESIQSRKLPVRTPVESPRAHSETKR